MDYQKCSSFHTVILDEGEKDSFLVIRNNCIIMNYRIPKQYCSEELQGDEMLEIIGAM